jgi:hypothetical protein
MVTILFAVASILVFRFRSCAALELKLVALEHQLAVLRRQRPGRPQLSSLDLASMGVALPDLTPGHRRDGSGQARNRGRMASQRLPFLYWRWRSGRPGRPRIGPEIRYLIRRISNANPTLIRRINARKSAAICGRPPRFRDFQRQ